jgi:hypothetical protein
MAGRVRKADTGQKGGSTFSVAPRTVTLQVLLQDAQGIVNAVEPSLLASARNKGDDALNV